MASGLLDAVNSVIGKIATIPYDWNAISVTHSRQKNLFQLVRMWNDQITRSLNGSGDLFESPACFIELRSMDIMQFGNNESYSEYIWRFHIADMQLDAGNDTDADQNLQVIAYRDALKQALTAFQPAQCTTMFAVNEEQDYNHTGVYHYIMDFKSGFTDTKGTTIDPDQTTVTFKDPNTNADIKIGYGDTPNGTDPLDMPVTFSDKQYVNQDGDIYVNNNGSIYSANS